MKMRRKPRLHRGSDGWGRDSYMIPAGSVVGSSDTGMWEDSPAPSDKVKDELERFRRDVLRPEGIRSRVRWSASGNVFMVKRWVVVPPGDFERAAQLAVDWLAEHKDDTDFIHDADLDDLGYKPAEQARVPA